MENLLPVFVILAFFVLSFWGQRWANTPLGVVLSCGVMIFFLVMAWVDHGRLYFHLLFAILAAALAWRGARSSGLLSKFGSPSAARSSGSSSE